MTCIVGITHGGRVYLAGDSAGVSGLDITVRRDPKVFRNGEMVIGFTSSFRMGQILQYAFTPPPIPDDDDLMAYMVSRFVPAIREAFRTEGFTHIDHSREWGGTFLVGVRGRLFEISDDFQVGEPATDYAAVGCGEAYALGSLFGSKGAPTARITAALEAASYFSAGVTAPFITVSTAKGGK